VAQHQDCGGLNEQEVRSSSSENAGANSATPVILIAAAQSRPVKYRSYSALVKHELFPAKSHIALGDAMYVGPILQKALNRQFGLDS
jgi:hypothetical protein